MSTGLEHVTCNLCGSSRQLHVYSMPDMHYGRDEWFDVVECGDCGLGFVNPRPGPKAIDRYYPRDFFDHFERADLRHDERYAREAAFLDRVPARADGSPRRLLDVGCANGGFPRFMKAHGWAVEGVEIASQAASIDDFPVYRVPFPEIPVTEARYDAVTAWAVIEHVHDPMAYFRKAASVLRPGGTFAFLVTNFESISSRFLFREDVPRHLYFFTQPTVQAYLERNGLVLEQAVFDDSIFEMIPVHWLHHNLRRLTGRPPMKWADLPETRIEWLARTGRKAGLAASLTYAATHPLTVFDRSLLPLYEAWQKRTKTYGIVTYVARKSGT